MVAQLRSISEEEYGKLKAMKESESSRYTHRAQEERAVAFCLIANPANKE